VVAKNIAQGSYVAGCPTEKTGQSQQQCKRCETTH